MQEKSSKSASNVIRAGSFHYAVVFIVAVIAASCFRVVAYPPTGDNWEYGDGEFSFHGVMTSLLFLVVTTAFFMCISLLRFLVIGFPFEMLLQILLLLWSILHLVCLVAVMPLRLFNYGGLGVSSAVIFFYYLKVKEEHQRLQSAGNV